MIQIDEDIVIRCQRGEKDAFREVVAAYQRMVFSLALKMLCDEDEAKDMVQETFVKVWLNMSEYDCRRSFSTWIYTIALRTCLDRIKSQRRTLPMPEDEAVFRDFATEEDGLRTLENREWGSIVRVLAEGRGGKQRVVFTLVQLEGFSSQEVEEMTGWDAKQVKSNLYVARQTIRERLKMLGYE